MRANGEELSASASGNDTLIAGNGNNDILAAGGGIDTLISGTGNDRFETLDLGLATGSVIQGGGGNDILDASGDISEATISGVQTLIVDFDTTLTAAEFNSFNSIQADSGPGTIEAATGGVY